MWQKWTIPKSCGSQHHRSVSHIACPLGISYDCASCLCVFDVDWQTLIWDILFSWQGKKENCKTMALKHSEVTSEAFAPFHWLKQMAWSFPHPSGWSENPPTEKSNTKEGDPERGRAFLNQAHDSQPCYSFYFWVREIIPKQNFIHDKTWNEIQASRSPKPWPLIHRISPCCPLSLLMLF